MERSRDWEVHNQCVSIWWGPSVILLHDSRQEVTGKCPPDKGVSSWFDSNTIPVITLPTFC